MKLSFRFFTALMALLLAACASTPTSPDWLSGESHKYPRAEYLTGRGQADTREAAQDRARADIAKIFQVAVDTASTDTQSANIDAAGGVKLEQQATRSINTRTQQVVSGIQIADLWQDPTSKSWHALAVLPRLQAATRLRQQIGELDDATRQRIEQSRNASDLFQKIAAAQNAVQIQQEREALQKQLQIVDITGRGVEPQWSSAKLKADRDALLARVSIATRATGDAPAGTNELIAGALAQAGFAPGGADAPFILQAQFPVADLGLQDGWYWLRGSLTVVLMERDGSKVRGTHVWSLKANATTRDGATKRLMAQADATLKQELQGAIIEMATAK
jgi:hypothetical protein